MTARSRQRTVGFVWGEPSNGAVYGRVEGGPEDETLWVGIPIERTADLVGERIESSGRCRLAADLIRSELPSYVSHVDWRERAVDLNVRTPLTKREADVYVLRRWFGLDRTQIADELGISPNTVDNHLQRVKDIDSEMTRLVVDTAQSLGLVEDIAETLPGIKYVGD
jgi:hypothetical protein